MKASLEWAQFWIGAVPLWAQVHCFYAVEEGTVKVPFCTERILSHNSLGQVK